MRKVIYSLLVIFSLTLCVFFVTESYAKYITSAQGNANMKVARWKIIVNNEDIRDNKNLETEIKPTFLESEHIASDVIAPTSEGYFDLIIDATQADVSFKYKITLENADNAVVKDLKIKKYKVNGIESTDANGYIEKEVFHKDNNQIINIRVYIYWDESENSVMTNEEDTNATLLGSTDLKVNLSFTQIV